jgi:hypothetical protein
MDKLDRESIKQDLRIKFLNKIRTNIFKFNNFNSVGILNALDDEKQTLLIEYY